MGFFGKLKFWGKKEDFDFGADLGKDPFGKDSGFGELGSNNFEMDSPSDKSFGSNNELGSDLSPQQSFEQPSFQRNQNRQQSFSQPQVIVQTPQPSAHEYAISKDIEVLSSKMDAMRAGLESMNQRLMNIERIIVGEERRPPNFGW